MARGPSTGAKLPPHKHGTVRRLFIVGTPRSGTTLVQSILAANPGIYSLPETHFFSQIVPRMHSAARAGLARPAFLIHEARHHHRVPELWMRPHVRRFTSMLDEGAKAQEAVAWIEKTPRHLHFIEAIERYVENPEFIHVIRDGAANAHSLVRVTQEHPDAWGGARTYRQALKRWQSDLLRSSRFVERANHHFLRYETLVRAPEQTTSRLLDALDMNSDANIVKAMLKSRTLAAEAVSTADEPWKAANQQGAILTDRNRSNTLSPSDQRLAAKVSRQADPVLERFPFL